MRAPFTQLYLHCVWATWDRLPLLEPEIERAAYPAILEKCKSMGCKGLAIGGVQDRVHVLVQMHPVVSVSEFIKGVKGASSHLVTHQVKAGEFFKGKAHMLLLRSARRRFLR